MRKGGRDRQTKPDKYRKKIKRKGGRDRQTKLDKYTIRQVKRPTNRPSGWFKGGWLNIQSLGFIETTTTKTDDRMKQMRSQYAIPQTAHTFKKNPDANKTPSLANFPQKFNC